MDAELQLKVLEQLPNPLLVKDDQTRYLWVNEAFCTFFGRDESEIIGRLDAEVFTDRQAAQCNGGDLRVLDSGEVDHAGETVFRPNGESFEIITRKSRVELSDGSRVLVGVLHDVTEVSRLNDRLQASQDQLASQAIELKRLSITDPLTGCLNRRGLQEQANSLATAGNGAVLVIDVDDFKKVNDRWGHDVGDAALLHLVAVINQQLREDDLVARLGGEEFVVAAWNCSAQRAADVGERIRKALEASPVVIDDEMIFLTASIGVVHGIDDVSRLPDALVAADRLLYAAKNEGRNRVNSDALVAAR